MPVEIVSEIQNAGRICQRRVGSTASRARRAGYRIDRCISSLARSAGESHCEAALRTAHGESCPEIDFPGYRENAGDSEADARLLQPGALALVPHGQGHRLWSEPGALKDRQIGRVITLIHRDPAHAWSAASVSPGAVRQDRDGERY